MKSIGALKDLLSFAQRNERPLGAALFAFGFLLDIFTFWLLPFETVNYIFLGYLVLAALSALGAHYFAGAAEKERESWWRKTLAVVLPLVVQYAFGGLLSGLFMFYAIHSFVAASWPFILLLAVMYFGNEYFRMYKHYLVFQTTLFFFTLYAYTIFALPLLVHQIGPWVFAGSTLLAVVVFGCFIFLLRLINKVRFGQSLKRIMLSTGALVAAISLSYVLGLIPPVPLTLSHIGAYHSLTKIDGGYRVLAEEAHPWWNPLPPTLHLREDDTLYAFSAVSAPIRFSASVAHRWERYVDGEGWVTVSRVSFPIYGGRVQGYRGYSYHSSLSEGKWRVSVETLEGQVIGRMRFDIQETGTRPVLEEHTL